MEYTHEIQGPIFTEENNCQDCYKCVRRCPVKAIKIENHRASIIHDSCIYCGICVTHCPAKAKKVRDDVWIAKSIISKSNCSVLSIAPSWSSEFQQYSEKDLVSKIKQLGFDTVSEAAIGAEILSEKASEFLQNRDSGIHISSCCPTIVSLIEKHYPSISNNILPYSSPAEIHANLLKSYYGKKCNVVFAGPCIAKKNESDSEKSEIDVAITFKELKKWIESEEDNNQIKNDESFEFSPFRAKDGNLYPIDGGMIKGINSKVSIIDTNFMSFSGIDTCMDILSEIENNPPNEKIFLELLACEGGCINGPATSKKPAPISRRLNIIKSNSYNYSKNNIPTTEAATFTKSYKKSVSSITNKNISEKDITEALSSINKISEKDELNCGGCGYNSCRDFCLALLSGNAEREMCVSYMREIAQNKSSVLLQKIPYGVVMVNEDLKIIESNQNFSKLIDDDTYALWDSYPGLAGADLRKVAPFHHHFSALISSGAEGFDTYLRFKDQLYRLSVFTIQKHKIICGIIHDLKDPATRQEEVVKRAQQVIRESLSTVQQVAYLLGENASNTEAMLNSIVESFKERDDNEI